MTKTTAQDASGSTIVSADDLRLDRFGHAHALTRPIAVPEEAVDAAGPVDAQTRPPRLGKRRTVSHSAHRHHWIVCTEERRPNPGSLVMEAQDSLHCRTPQRRFAPITMPGPTDHDDVD